MSKILLINPIERGAAKRPKKRRAKKAGRKTTRKPTTTRGSNMAAKKRRRKSAKRRTVKRTTTRRAAPKRRRSVKRRARRSVAVRHANPIRRRSRRVKRRRNPISLGGMNIKHITGNLVMPAAMGAAGALVLDIAWANLPIPANLKTGYVGDGVKLAGAVLLTMLASKFLGKQKAEAMGVGMITIQGYNLGRKLLGQMMPTLKLAGDDMGWIEAGYPVSDQVGEYVSEYISGDNLEMHALPETDYSSSELVSMGEYISGDEDYGQY